MLESPPPPNLLPALAATAARAGVHPYDNTANENREFAEYYIFEEEYYAGRVRDDALTGYVSWKFSQKTKLGSRFLEFVQANP